MFLMNWVGVGWCTPVYSALNLCSGMRVDECRIIKGRRANRLTKATTMNCTKTMNNVLKQKKVCTVNNEQQITVC